MQTLNKTRSHGSLFICYNSRLKIWLL